MHINDIVKRCQRTLKYQGVRSLEETLNTICKRKTRRASNVNIKRSDVTASPSLPTDGKWKNPEGGRIDGKLFWQWTKENSHRISCGQAKRRFSNHYIICRTDDCVYVFPVRGPRISRLRTLRRSTPPVLAASMSLLWPTTQSAAICFFFIISSAKYGSDYTKTRSQWKDNKGYLNKLGPETT